jgi:hexosaminidase
MAVHSLIPPLVPKPNGRAHIFANRMVLPHEISVAGTAFPKEFLGIFAERMGCALQWGGKRPVLRVYRNPAFPAEGYRLRISKERGIQLEAATEQGLCWALTTLYTLRVDGGFLCCDIMDAPAYPYRGILLDSARHFWPVETVKEFIEAISLVKINTLHWHLTDDQGFRVESKLFPRLHRQFTPEEGRPLYYTQDEIRGIVEFARLRGVEIVPEIDLPGHATSILAIYPELSCSEKRVKLEKVWGVFSVVLCPGKEAVFELLLPLLEEIAGLFPSRRFHLGGDEVPKQEWENCPHCRRRMAQEGLATPEELQGWFTARVAAHLRQLGKSPICWNESLRSERLPEWLPELTIQYWAEMHKAGPARRFLEAGGQMIFSDYIHVYLDQPYGAVSLKKVYHYAPKLPWQPSLFCKRAAPAGIAPGPEAALGLEACVWTEYITTPDRLIAMAFPRAYALAEAAWTSPGRKDYQAFTRRLAAWLQRHPYAAGTPFRQADPAWAESHKGRLAFLQMQAKAPRPEGAVNLGGPIDFGYLLRWLQCFLL